MRDDEAWASEKMTAKVPPSYDGTSSLFAYEENVGELLLITTIEPDKQAALLRFRLKGTAIACRKLLDADRLKQAGAVKYYLDTLRFFVHEGPGTCFPMVVSEVIHVYPWQF